jgi:anti-sigma B factor antagonist
METFECRLERVGDMVVIRAAGGLDAFTARRMGRALDGVPDPFTGAVLVDLSDVDFVDRAGIGVLVALARRARELGLVTTLAGPRASVRPLLERVGFERIAVIAPALQREVAAAR